jgi:hypothetical protein
MPKYIASLPHLRKFKKLRYILTHVVSWVMTPWILISRYQNRGRILLQKLGTDLNVVIFSKVSQLNIILQRCLTYYDIVFFLFFFYLGGGIKVYSTLRPLNGLLCQPRVIMIMEKSVEWWLAGEIEVLGENLPQYRFIHHKPPHAARTRTRAAAVGSQRLTAELRHGPMTSFS